MSISTILGNSGLATGLNLLNYSPTLFSINARSFKSKNVNILDPCNIQEKHTDRYEVTRHPTEMGVLISDHMFALPQVVEIQVGYSVSSGINALKSLGSLVGVSTLKSNDDYYKAFLKLQSDRIPFSITTGKRQYQNMVLTTVEENTDGRTENSVFLHLRAEEVIIVNTTSYTSADVQADAPNTSAPVNTGSQSTSGPSTYSLPPNAPITGAPL